MPPSLHTSPLSSPLTLSSSLLHLNSHTSPLHFPLRPPQPAVLLAPPLSLCDLGTTRGDRASEVTLTSAAANETKPITKNIRRDAITVIAAR